VYVKDSGAAFGFDVVDNFYTGSGHDMLLKPSTSKGGHGFDPQRPAMHASLILNGSAVRTRGSLGRRILSENSSGNVFAPPAPRGEKERAQCGCA